MLQARMAMKKIEIMEKFDKLLKRGITDVSFFGF